MSEIMIVPCLHSDTAKSRNSNHLKERLLDQVQAWAPYTALSWGQSCPIPLGMISDVQPLVASTNGRSMPQHLFLGPVGGVFEACRSTLKIALGVFWEKYRTKLSIPSLCRHLSEGAHSTLCVHCANSRLFFTTGSHGPQVPEFCTLQHLLVHQAFFILV